MPSRSSPGLTALATRTSRGDTRPSVMVSDALDRLDRIEPHVRAWVHVDRAGAMDTARALDEEPHHGPLHGVPVGVKDIIDVVGLPTECGSPLRHGWIADRDAPIVSRLRELGAVPLGKTVTTEFAYFAPGPTRNPHRLSHTPGGSSSGSAAAVAAGVVSLALGSQTAGSLTRPASYCGVAGLVAPVGALDTTGFVGLSHTLDAVGLLAPTVADLRFAYRAVSGTDPFAAPPPLPGDLTVSVWQGTELVEVSEPMQRAVTRAAADTAARIRHVEWEKMTPLLVETHATIMAYEACRALESEARRPDQLSTPLNELIDYGRSLSEDEYRRASDARARARTDILSLLLEVDAVVGPAAPGSAPEGLAATGSPILSRPWQLLGLPALAVPGHRDDTGLPLGIQLIGHPDRLEQLFAAGELIEQAATRNPSS